MYYFHIEWETELFTMINSKCNCLICHISVSIQKIENIQRHFSSLYRKYNDDIQLNSEIRTLKLLRSISLVNKKLTYQQNTFVNLVSKPILVTVA